MEYLEILGPLCIILIKDIDLKPTLWQGQVGYLIRDLLRLCLCLFIDSPINVTYVVRDKEEGGER